MGLITGFLTALTKTTITGSIAESEFIFYKIVNFNEKANKYLLQCINTKATFLATLNDIVLDGDILHGLHPIQACYVGIEYKINIKNDQKSVIFSDSNICSYSFCRYGTLSLRYQDRKKNLCFVDLNTQKEFTMDPRDIALSEHLISEFDAIQAFYIGLLAGLRMKNSTAVYKEKNNKPKLSLIKK